MTRYEEIKDTDIDWVIEEICSNLTEGQLTREIHQHHIWCGHMADGDPERSQARS